MSFAEKLDRKQFVITSEVQVSTETDTESILGGLKRIKGEDRRPHRLGGRD